MSGVGRFLAGLLPSVGLGVLFWYAMRSIVRADRHERAAEAEADRRAEERDNGV